MMEQEKSMKKSIVAIVILSLSISFVIIKSLLADTGWEGAIRLERGRSSTPTQISVTGSATQIVAASAARPDCTCFNNTATTLWIGGDNTVSIANGFPILSSATFKADAFTGTIFGICDTGTCDVRCWIGTTP